MLLKIMLICKKYKKWLWNLRRTLVVRAAIRIKMLNKEQKEAVEHEYGPCFVCSCPGSGKTTVITQRTMRLLEKGHNPRNILCITFTNKAAAEMKERIHKKIGDDADQLYISTFHALAATILRKYGQYLGYDASLIILDDDDQQELLVAMRLDS
jgi:DNA helicase-2/ATP-dependent DNA helicase PcrA